MQILSLLRTAFLAPLRAVKSNIAARTNAKESDVCDDCGDPAIFDDNGGCIMCAQVGRYL